MAKVYHRNTPTERVCPECKGAGSHVVNRTNPRGYGPDPQCDEDVPCRNCIGGWIRWAPHDPLTLLAPLRRTFLDCRGFEPTYRNMRKRATAPTLGMSQLRMVEAAIRCDLQGRDAVTAWRLAA